VASVSELRALLKKRQGRPGFKINAAAIERMIELEETGPWRDKETGQFVTTEFAFSNPELVERAD
jgi:hypothetical protein